ncbi:MAG: acetyl-CoA synthetase [Chloroflexota bacterium]|jgi:acetyl-CoA synthetase|nr:acetyl-CoA synthetase [Chloroflexota bacterium]
MTDGAWATAESAARSRAVVEEARRDPESFWAGVADGLPWFRRWDRVFVPEPPSFRWFDGGLTNLSYNALDRHVLAGRGGHVALIALSEAGDRRTLTYAELLAEVTRVASALRGLGIGRRDRVTVYMPTCVEAIVALLAIVRIGAIHSVVFAGFGHAALGDRIRASGSRLVLAADVTFRKGVEVPLKPIVDRALAKDPGAVEHVVVLERGTARHRMERPRDLAWPEFLALGEGHPDAHEEMEANEPAFILATSGTTARPKLAVHTHGGYQVHIHAMGRWVFDLAADDVWWSTSDIGWIVGHSYIVYAPLLAGATTVSYEGALDHPNPETFWRVVDELGVTGVFSSPTAIRMLMRYGEEPARRYPMMQLRRLASAGEVLNAPAWAWLQKTVLGDRIPVIDHMWQTETGGPVFGNPFGLGMLPIKPGSAGICLPGIQAEVVSVDGTPLPAGEKGIMTFTRPFPGLIASLWGEPERYGTDYWSRIPGRYSTGDAAHFDEDGYAWFAGRADEIIKIAAHRLGTIEVETAFLHHPAVAEVGATGMPDALRGEVIAAFVVLKQGRQESDVLRGELMATLRDQLGPLAVVGQLSFVATLPKTRSGKIMRRVLKAVVGDLDPGDITTIEDEGSVEDARQAVAELKAAGAADGRLTGG